MTMADLTHLTPSGDAHMVDVGAKADTGRVAEARGRVTMNAGAFEALVRGNLKKGDALGVARIAGIMAAKRASDIIPLCHPIALTHVSVTCEPEPDAAGGAVSVHARVACTGKTGVEMEALTAVSAAALTIYDMCKALDRGMRISDIRLVHKSGGKSGEFAAE